MLFLISEVSCDAEDWRNDAENSAFKFFFFKYIEKVF